MYLLIVSIFTHITHTFSVRCHTHSWCIVNFMITDVQLWFLVLFVLMLLAKIFIDFLKARKKNKALEAIISERTQELQAQTESLAQKHEMLVSVYNKQEILIEIGQQLTSDLDFSAVFSNLYTHLRTLMPVDLFAVFIYQEDEFDFRYLIKDNEPLAAFKVEVFSEKESLASWCVFNNKSIYIANASEAKNYPPNKIPYIYSKKAESVIYQPLVIGKKIIGGFTVQAYQADAYSEQHLEIIKLLSPYTTVALQNAQAFHQQQIANEALRQSKKELDYLNRLLSTVSHSLDLDVVLKTFHDVISEIFDFDGGIIQLIDDKKRELYIYTAYGNLSENILKKYKDYPLPLDSNLSATTYVAKKGNIVYTPQVSKKSEMQPFDRQVHDVYPFVSGLFVPIVLNEKILGCISFLSLQKEFTLRPEEIQNIQLYVSQIAFAINNAILYKNSQAAAQLIQTQHKQLEQVNHDLHQKNKAITDSINYASHLQENILPHDKELKQLFKEYALFFKPKDVLSGDFYWTARHYHYKIIAVADCTGHGVPGAFMTVMGSIFLNSIMSEEQFIEPRHILTELDKRVRQVLGNKPNTDDIIGTGMEMGICLIDETRKQIQYAGANIPLLQINSNGNLNFITGDRMLIGIGNDNEVEKLFTSYIVSYQEGDVFYMYSDGFKDQFGGANGRKYGGKKFRDFIASIALLPLAQQTELFEQEINTWRNHYEQVDDILVLGFRP